MNKNLCAYHSSNQISLNCFNTCAEWSIVTNSYKTSKLVLILKLTFNERAQAQKENITIY